MEKKLTSDQTKQTLRSPALWRESWTEISVFALRNAPESSRENIQLVIRAMASPSEQLRNPVNTDKVKAALVTMAAAYCGANTNETAATTWRECAEWLRKEYPAIIADEVLEAFRFAASPRCPHPVNFAAYRGQFTVEILKQVMSAYHSERRAIQAAIEKSFDQVEAQKRQSDEEEKDRQARRQFVLDFRRLKASGDVPELEKIRFFWFDALKNAGELDGVKDDERRDLWAESAELLRIEMTGRGMESRKEVGVRRLLEEMKETGVIPDDWKGKRETIYKRLLIRQALMNAVMDQLPQSDERFEVDHSDIPF